MPLAVIQGGTGAITAAGARANLGLEIGTDVEAWSASLDSLAALPGNGIIAQTGANSFANVSITATSNQTSVTNGSGASGNPIVGLSSTMILPGTLTLGGTLSTAGSTITNSVTNGNLTIATNGTGLMVLNATQGINGVSNDSSFADDSATLVPTQAAVLSLFNTLNGKFSFVSPPAQAATTSNYSATYSNGTAGVGATLTATSNGAAIIDGVTLSVNDIVLFKDQTSKFQNGLYYLSTNGDVSNPSIFTRSTNYDTSAEITPGTIAVVLSGTVNAKTLWVEVATVTTVGTDSIVFVSYAQGTNTFVTLSTNQNITGIKTFSSGSLVLAGASSGTTTLIPSDPAGTTTLTLPALTDTVTTSTNTATLTNKTISGSSNTLSNISYASLANGTAGNLITWSALGAPALVSTGTSGQILTSNGAGAAPTFQDLSSNFGAITVTSVTFNPTTSGIVGTTTNDNASTGIVGEYISNSATITPFATTPTTICSISLTAGDWDVSGSCQPGTGNIDNAILVGISLTNNAFMAPLYATQGAILITNLIQANILGACVVTTPVVRISIASPTTVYLIGQANNGGGTPTLSGFIRARRMR